MKRNCTEASFDRQLNFRRNVFVEKNHQPNTSSFNETNLDIKEAATRGVLCKKVFLLRSFTKLTGKQLCQSLFFNKVASLRPATWGLFSCEFCEISKNTLFTEYLWTTASGIAFCVLWPIFYCHFFFAVNFWIFSIFDEKLDDWYIPPKKYGWL